MRQSISSQPTLPVRAVSPTGSVEGRSNRSLLPGEFERRARRLALIVGAHSSEVYPQIRNRDGVVVKWFVTGRGWYSEKGEAL